MNKSSITATQEHFSLQTVSARSHFLNQFWHFVSLKSTNSSSSERAQQLQILQEIITSLIFDG